MANWYVNSVAYAAVAQWAASHTYAAGSIVRQFAAVGSGAERCFRTAGGGTSGTAEPIWNTNTGGVSNADGTVTDWTDITGIETYQAPGVWAAPLARLPQPGLGTSGLAVNTTVGTGWAAGDFAYIVGGTHTQQAIVKILTVSSGKPATISLWDPGSYTAQTPAAPALLAISPSIGTAGALLNALTLAMLRAAGATDAIMVASAHSETQSAVPIMPTFAGTIKAPTEILCIDESASGNVPPQAANLKTGAVIATTSFAGNITLAGNFHSYGINWKSGGTFSGVLIFCNSTTGIEHQIVEAGSLQLTDNANVVIFIGIEGVSLGKKFELINSSVYFSNAASTIDLSSVDFHWRNTGGTAALVAGSTAPTTMLSPLNNWGGVITVDGVDFSGIGSNNVVSSVSTTWTINLRNCKFGSSTVPMSFPGAPGVECFVYNCDSGNTNYKSSKIDYRGTESTNVSVTRVGGATDGITPQSRQISTSVEPGFSVPFESMPMMIWNDLVGSPRNVTLFGTINAAVPPANNELWLEVEYFEDAASPLASFIDDRMANVLATPAAQTADVASTWNGGGSGAGWSPFKLSVTLTAQQHGYIVCRVKAAKASTTYYIDPPGAGTLS